MSYEVIKAFRDKTDNLKLINVGDPYSHGDEGRVAYLVKKGFLTEKSKQPPKDDIKHVGGGWYELPNGEKVKGKDEALAALEGGE